MKFQFDINTMKNIAKAVIVLIEIFENSNLNLSDKSEKQNIHRF